VTHKCLWHHHQWVGWVTQVLVTTSFNSTTSSSSMSWMSDTSACDNIIINELHEWHKCLWRCHHHPWVGWAILVWWYHHPWMYIFWMYFWHELPLLRISYFGQIIVQHLSICKVPKNSFRMEACVCLGCLSLSLPGTQFLPFEKRLPKKKSS
jgi:hypothetical protein